MVSRKLDRRGFTLVELLAVLIILIAIMGIAIPTISSSLERTKEKQNQSRYKILESTAELYVTDYKNTIYNKLDVESTNACVVRVSQLDDYLSDEDRVDFDGYYIIFTKPNNYKFSESKVDASGNDYIDCID